MPLRHLPPVERSRTKECRGVTELLFPVEEGPDTVIVAMAIDRASGTILSGPAPIPAFTTPAIQSVPFGSDFDPAGTLWLTIGEIGDSGPAFSLVAVHGAPSDLSTVVSATTIGALATPPWAQSFALAHDPAAVLPATGAAFSPALIALGATALAGGGVLLTRASRAPRRPSSAR